MCCKCLAYLSTRSTLQVLFIDAKIELTTLISLHYFIFFAEFFYILFGINDQKMNLEYGTRYLK